MNPRPKSASKFEPFGYRCGPHIKEINTIPKFANYQQDGSGRDFYIKTDNGGFANVYKTTPTGNKSILFDNSKSCEITPKFPIYKPDGRGRDSFIYTTCGGFFNTNPKTCFIDNLRKYDSYSRVRSNNYAYYSNHFRSKQEVKANHLLYQKQKQDCERLSRPKYLFNSYY